MVSVTNSIGTTINLAAQTGMIRNDALTCTNAIDTITVSDRIDLIEVPDGFRHSESRKRV